MFEFAPDGESARLMVVALDLAGTFAFAVLGALAAARRGLDLFGVLERVVSWPESFQPRWAENRKCWASSIISGIPKSLSL
jgi:hypothetical protein